MLKHNIINKITVIFIWAPSNCKSNIATRVGARRQKWLRNLQPNMRISDIPQIYRFHYESKSSENYIKFNGPS